MAHELQLQELADHLADLEREVRGTLRVLTRCVDVDRLCDMAFSMFLEHTPCAKRGGIEHMYYTSEHKVDGICLVLNTCTGEDYTQDLELEAIARALYDTGRGRVRERGPLVVQPRFQKLMDTSQHWLCRVR